MAGPRVKVFGFGLVDGRRRNHTDLVLCHEPEATKRGPARPSLYVLAEHTASNGHEHRFCRIVMEELVASFDALVDAGAGGATALAGAVEAVNRELWEGGQNLPAQRRLPIGLSALALDGADAYLCQVATGQIFVERGDEQASVPPVTYWEDVHAGKQEAAPALGLQSATTPAIVHARLAPGDRLLLLATNVARLIDAATLALLARQNRESLLANLVTVAEDFGIQNTGGVLLEVGELAGAAAPSTPLRLKAVFVTDDGALVGPSDGGAWRDEALPGAETAPPAPLPHLPADESLPQNVVRLYSTPPLAPVAAAPELEAGAPAAPQRAASWERPSRRRRRPASAGWLDGLVAAMAASARRPEVPPQAAETWIGGSEQPVAAPVGGTASAAALSLPAVRLPGSLLQIGVLVGIVGLGLGLISIIVTHGLPRPATSVASVSDASASAVVAPRATFSPEVPTEAEIAALRAQAAAVPAAAADAEVSAGDAAAPPRAATARVPAPTLLTDLAGSGTPETAPKQLVVSKAGVFVLDPYAGTVFALEADGRAPTPVLSRGWMVGRDRVGDLLGATLRGDTLVVMDRQHAYSLDGPNGTWKVSALAATSLPVGAYPVATFDGNLYVLDSANGKVLKYAKGSFGKAPQPWLRTADRTKLAGAIDLAIDGKIYALTPTGQLLTMFRGVVERKATVDVTPPLVAPAALACPAGSNYLYLADTNGRILKLTKAGALVAEWRVGDGVAGVSDLWVDEVGRVAYVVAGNRVLKVSLADAAGSGV